jgi:hypothetical protein
MVNHTFRMIDACNDGFYIKFRLFGPDRNVVWPAPPTYWHNEQENVVTSVTISCVKDERICYGGETGDRFWGVGLDGTAGCTGCCQSCGGNYATTQFTCN